MDERNIINAIGALAEMSSFFMKQLLKQGFTRKEALSLTQAFIMATCTPKNKEEF